MFAIKPDTRRIYIVMCRNLRKPGLLACMLFLVWCFYPNTRHMDDTQWTRRERYEKYQASESGRRGLGEMGAAATVSPEQAESFKDINEKEGFNFGVSELVSLDRSIPDKRSAGCKARNYPTSLPKASVIISYFNEAPSVILRTAHSVINRSPPEYLEEVVLLDDSSTRDDVLEDMHKHIADTWPDGIVRVVRTPERYGLIKAKLYGAQAAKGPVLIFLDAHCEAGPGWIEPILAEIKEDPTRVICPSIGNIDPHTLQYVHTGGSSRGGFSWSMFFTWESRPKSELAKSKGPEYAYPSPTMAGGLFATDKEFFFRIGAYDDGMEIWGGENLDLSFRTWMCGGSLLFHPCSLVGHIFRPNHPYGFPDEKRDYHGRNTKRMVEVWLDEYKRYFYLHRPELPGVDVGDLSERRAIRKREQCQSFDWYLNNVYPEKFKLDVDVIAYGLVRNPSTNYCFDMLRPHESYTYKHGVYPCHSDIGTNQLFSLTRDGLIRTELACMSYKSDDNIPMEMHCDPNDARQVWSYSKEHGQILNKSSGKCLDIKGLKLEGHMKVSDCNSDDTQKWEWTNYIGEVRSDQS